MRWAAHRWCRPSVLMNPILLKPVTNMGSQVIVMGEVLGNYHAQEYYKMKHTLRPYIMEAFNRLSDENDIIVIEGAGSPAEINLKADDFVNMGMAKMAKAPVLLVGDIDRGGVFAQLYGTIELLDPDEKELVKATIINNNNCSNSLCANDILEDGRTAPNACAYCSTWAKKVISFDEAETAQWKELCAGVLRSIEDGSIYKD